MSQDQIDQIMSRLDKIDKHLENKCRDCGNDVIRHEERLKNVDKGMEKLDRMFWAIIVLIAGQYFIKFIS